MRVRSACGMHVVWPKVYVKVLGSDFDQASTQSRGAVQCPGAFPAWMRSKLVAVGLAARGTTVLARHVRLFLAIDKL